MESMNDDILFDILALVKPSQSVALVCQRWSMIYSTESFWKEFLIRDHQQDSSFVELEKWRSESSSTWKNVARLWTYFSRKELIRFSDTLWKVQIQGQTYNKDWRISCFNRPYFFELQARWIKFAPQLAIDIDLTLDHPEIPRRAIQNLSPFTESWSTIKTWEVKHQELSVEQHDGRDSIEFKPQWATTFFRVNFVTLLEHLLSRSDQDYHLLLSRLETTREQYIREIAEMRSQISQLERLKEHKLPKWERELNIKKKALKKKIEDRPLAQVFPKKESAPTLFGNVLSCLQSFTSRMEQQTATMHTFIDNVRLSKCVTHVELFQSLYVNIPHLPTLPPFPENWTQEEQEVMHELYDFVLYISNFQQKVGTSIQRLTNATKEFQYFEDLFGALNVKIKITEVLAQMRSINSM
eukprot:TRINITY_DN10973_c0_g1_i1.p1 TRINITY_DN10973_c0_g1~~TRINITY_DN10973_c0_g1_i1.p1  ORF type:complete len:411 (+),score=51.10 TRINITY_DN10973_c0_g1_i1:119-1351(+)